MFTISNAPAGIILVVTVLFMLVLSSQIYPDTKAGRYCQSILWFSAINVAAVAGMYLFWAWTPVEVAIEFRAWAKLVDGLAAFGVAGAMIGLHKSLQR